MGKSYIIMNIMLFFLPMMVTSGMLPGWSISVHPWLAEIRSGYTIYYTPADTKTYHDYSRLIDEGMINVRGFFSSPFIEHIDIYIHPNRHSFDSTWQKDWEMPEFKSECWMVASGVANRMDMISPIRWDEAACEHRNAEKQKVQQLITHELVHVFHAQNNMSKDFSSTKRAVVFGQ